MPPKKAKKPKKKVKKQKGNGLYQTISNKLLGSDLGKNELHAPQKTAKGWTMGAYIGPNTDVYNNIRKGKKPVSETDKVSLAHDLRYGLSRSTDAIRQADLKMVNKLKEIKKNKKDYKINIALGSIPIRAKMKLEDLGIMKKGSFGGDLKGVEPENQELAEKTLKDLEMQGYGKSKPKKNKWLDHVSKVRSKNKEMSYKECLKKASSSYKK